MKKSKGKNIRESNFQPDILAEIRNKIDKKICRE